MKKYALALLIFLPLLVAAQVDSLERKLPTLQHAEKAKAYANIITYYIRADLQKAKQYLTEAKQFSKTENDPLIKTYIWIAQGLYYSTSGLTDSARYVFEEAKNLALKEKNNSLIIRADAALGKNFITAGNPEKGLENLFEALKLLEANPDPEVEMKVRVNIMWAYLELKRHKDCVEFGRVSIREADPKFEWIKLVMYSNIAVSFGALNELDSAKYYIGKGMDAAKATGDFQSIANGHFILGTIYSKAGELKLAIQEYLKARPYRDKVGNPSFLISDLYSISSLYHQLGEYRKGVDAGLEGLKIAEQYHSLLKFEGVYQSLAENYEGLGDFKSASKYYNLWAVAKDSIYKNATADAIAEMQTKYESEKKQQQIIIQDTQLAKQKAQIRYTYLVIAALMITLTLLFIIYFLAKSRFRRKQQLQTKENELFLRETYIKATIQSQESERKRFARDLHDSIGQLISSLRLLISTVGKNSSFEEKVNVVSKSEKILDEMYREIRSVAFNLMPQTLIQHGLLPALEEMASRINQLDSIQVFVRGFDLPARLEELQEISLYRIIQEWTNNVIKYSSASKIDIQLVGHDEEINVTIEDNGNGFAIEQLEKGKGNGWKNIQSRLNLVKGNAEIDSLPDRKGTTFVMRIPLTVKREIQI
jgi:two-component system, NarL family, sensor kinase